MKKRKKNLKGMTLVEMIISIAIFAIMGGVLVLIGTHIDNTSRATNNLKNKITKQSPYAANHITSFSYEAGSSELPSSDLDITVSVNDAGDYYTYIDPYDHGKGVQQKSYNNPSVVIPAKKYATEDIVNDGVSENEKKRIQNGPNNGLNLEFIEFVEPEEPEDPGETP